MLSTAKDASSRLWLVLRPAIPYILPLLVSLSFVPLILFLSASAGWFVWRNAAVGWQAPIYLQYGDGVSPYAEALLPPLAAQQRYDIALELKVPNIDANYALGNFMATLTLSTRSNKTIVSTRRPAIVIPRRASFYSRAPAVLDITIPLLTSYATGASRVIAHVEIGRRDHWKSLGNEQARELSVVAASLRGVVVHHGIRGLVTRAPLLSGFISAIAFLIVSSVMVGACILPLTFRRAAAVEQSISAQETITDIKPPLAISSSSSSDDSESGDEKPVQSSRVVKTEEDSETQSTSLRRRRSKLPDPDSSDSDT
ncbi:hypothetical protein FB45DRAFT_1058735 [Roridomyces roridus]|uniref:Seipin n=1 Tax=Roridomyces roridus TaxID=1738132 RepID=A0AAD7FNR3_9AGAR|nr:hypothetical protein FB45DRAFT_1058735 [Roridomyces roridus]